jgi:hypothetical protein
MELHNMHIWSFPSCKLLAVLVKLEVPLPQAGLKTQVPLLQATGCSCKT